MNYGDGESQHYTFDPMGNRLTLNTESYTYDNLNRLTLRGTHTYGYDANGNNTYVDGAQVNWWDTQNRLMQRLHNGSVCTFTYGADGLRRSMTLGGVTTSFLLDRQNAVQEIQNGSPAATCLVGPRGVEYRQDASGQRRWYIYDGLGSIIAEVDQDGKVNPDQQGNETPLRKYDVYGAIRNSQEVVPGTSNHKFVGSLGHTTEAPTGGLIYMRARYYDPAIGRFISEDPGRNGANWYVYCENNPVNLVDPDGQEGRTLMQELILFLGAPLALDIISGLMIKGAISSGNPYLLV